MKTAKCTVEKITIACPHCKALIPNDHDGSFLWDLIKLMPMVLYCFDCRKMCYSPKRTKATVIR